jgi:hypothetical protein
MADLLLRFAAGGVIVTLFSLCGEVLRPKRFAGLLGAAPSVALATIPLTVHSHGHLYAAMEARSMIAGAAAFLVYAYCVSRVLIKFKPNTLLTTVAAMPVWFAVAAALYLLCLRGAP